MNPAKKVRVVLSSTFSSPPTPTEFEEKVGKSRNPVVLKGFDIGPCSSKWTVDYLTNISPEKKVKVHKSKTPQLDFRRKNFTYETVSFSSLIQNCNNNQCVVQNSNHNQVNEKEDTAASNVSDENSSYFWYLRSLGDDPRGKDVSDLSVHFPELYADLKIPDFVPKGSFFSSVFRISSPKLQLWTHYDTCDNILIQVQGRKRVVFFPPCEALNLYLDGDKSKVIDVDAPDLKVYSDFAKAERYEVLLEPGDIVFIPALWFHNITALDFSVSVNVFWKNLSAHLYDKKDTYGNKDLIPAQLALRAFEKSTDQLKILPTEYQDFFLRRMIISLQEKLDKLNHNSSEAQ